MLAIWLGSLLLTAVASANMSAALSGSEALEEIVGVSRARSGLLEGFVPRQKILTVSESTMFMGPAMNNFDGHLNSRESAQPSTGPSSPNPSSPTGRHHRGASAGTVASSPAPSPKSEQAASFMSLRHSLNFTFHVSNRVTLGPSLSVSEPLQGPKTGSLVFADPQLKLNLADVLSGDWWGHKFSSGFSSSFSVPASRLSQVTHNHGGLSVGLSPKLRFAHSDFFLSGTATAKGSVTSKRDQEGMIYPGRLFAGLQVNCRISRYFHPFLMNYVTETVGPRAPTEEEDDSSTAISRTRRQGISVGLMPGMLIKAADGVTLCPRLNWVVEEPVKATTVGLNAMIQMI